MRGWLGQGEKDKNKATLTPLQAIHVTEQQQQQPWLRKRASTDKRDGTSFSGVVGAEWESLTQSRTSLLHQLATPHTTCIPQALPSLGQSPSPPMSHQYLMNPPQATLSCRAQGCETCKGRPASGTF